MADLEEKLVERPAQKAQSVRKAAPKKQMVARGAMEDERGTEAHEADDDVAVGSAPSFAEEDHALQNFLDAMQDSVLPDLPDIPGYHVCWLTTQNPRDPIARRLTAGYKLITVDEFPHLDGSSLKTGSYAGVIGINEMVAAKLPERQYQRAMGVLHHVRPLDEEQKIRAKVDEMKEGAARHGAPILEVGDGTADLGKGAPVPRFQ